MPRDRDDDDLPARRRRRDEDDRYHDDPPPRRRSREDEDDRRGPRTPSKQLSVLGLISLIKGIGALLASFMPCIGAIAILPGVLALGLGVLGLVMAKKSQGRQGSGLPIAGISVASAAIVISVVWIVVVGVFSKKVDESVKLSRAEREKEAEEIRSAPASRVTSKELAATFERDNYEGRDLYKGKVVEVTGKVTKVELGVSPEITLEGGRKISIVCDFYDESDPGLKAIKVGDQVTILGKYNYELATRVQVTRCQMVNSDPRGTERPAGKEDPKEVIATATQDGNEITVVRTSPRTKADLRLSQKFMIYVRYRVATVPKALIFINESTDGDDVPNFNSGSFHINQGSGQWEGWLTFDEPATVKEIELYMVEDPHDEKPLVSVRFKVDLRWK